jgi:hypothetical protein
MVDAKLALDIDTLLQGHCVYLPSFFCRGSDFTWLQGLTQDLQANVDRERQLVLEDGDGAASSVGMVNWSKHLKHENPIFSEVFNAIIGKMAEYFDVEVFATRLNFYRDGKDWKPFHHDSHAYGAHGKKEDFTMGASFGFERELAFRHEGSGQEFSFPQGNGDIFAFTSEANKRFKHGVPKCKSRRAGPRFSIIAWGRRRTINERNAGKEELRALEVVEEDKFICINGSGAVTRHQQSYRRPQTHTAAIIGDRQVQPYLQKQHLHHKSAQPSRSIEGEKQHENEVVEVNITEMVDRMVSEHARANRKPPTEEQHKVSKCGRKKKGKRLQTRYIESYNGSG